MFYFVVLEIPQILIGVYIAHLEDEVSWFVTASVTTSIIGAVAFVCNDAPYDASLWDRPDEHVISNHIARKDSISLTSIMPYKRVGLVLDSEITLDNVEQVTADQKQEEDTKLDQMFDHLPSAKARKDKLVV